MIGDPLNAAVNSAFGTNLQPVSKAVQGLADTAGLPKPGSPEENFSQAVASTGFGLLDPVMSGAQAAIKGAKSLGGGVRELYQQVPAMNVHDKLIQEAQKAGYQTPPSVAHAGKAGRAIEWAAGKQGVEAVARDKNQNVTSALARRAVGLPDDAPLDAATLNKLIKETYEAGYGPVRDMPRILAGGTYLSDLDMIGKKFQGMSRSFPGAADDEVQKLVGAYRTHQFSGKDALDAIENLRSNADDAYRQGKGRIGEAQRAVAKAIEDQIDNYVQRGGEVSPGVVQSFKEARKRLAKQYAVRDALTGEGNIDALKFGAMLKRGAPLTDELAQIGNFANVAKPVASVPREAAPFASGKESLIYGLASAISGNPLPAAIPIARGVAQRGLDTKLGQKLFAQPAGMHQPLDLPWMNAGPAVFNLGQQMGGGLYGQ